MLRLPQLPIVVLLVVLCACDSGVRDSASSPCPATLGASDATLQRTYAQFRQALESGPVVAMLGRPVSCGARAEDGSVRLEYGFAQGEKLEAQRDPAIELTEQRLTGAKLSSDAAIALLQRMEQQGFGQEGCEIAWREPPTQEAGSAPGSNVLVYRGTVCNCQGQLELTGGVSTGVVFRSAC